MNSKFVEPPAALAVIVGLLALACAIGIGRFSLTSVLPLMQRDGALPLTDAASASPLPIGCIVAAPALVLSNRMLSIEAIARAPSDCIVFVSPNLHRSSSRPGAIVMNNDTSLLALIQAVERYFALMQDNDVSRYDEVFASTAQLHGFRGTELRLLSAQDYKEMLASSASPKSKNAPRLEEILLVDLTSAMQALVKVRVRVDAIQYLDYLSYHRIGDQWLITAKSFHVERRYDEVVHA